MLKVRVMPILLYKNFGLVKGSQFNSWRHVGSLMQAIKVFNMRAVDELVFLDVAATLENRTVDFDLVDEFADECFMPLTVGGGVRCVDDIQHLLRVGADKVALNTAAVQNPSLIEKAAARFGSQCVVVSIDAKKENNRYTVYTHAGTQATSQDPVQLAQKVERLGAGEILLTSIDCEGGMQGYDLELIRRVSEAVSIPVIASGGAGSYEHLARALQDGGASAVSAGSLFYFTEQTPLEAKRYLKNKGIHVRV